MYSTGFCVCYVVQKKNQTYILIYYKKTKIKCRYTRTYLQCKLIFTFNKLTINQ